jgi:hypothetical protein
MPSGAGEVASEMMPIKVCVVPVGTSKIGSPERVIGLPIEKLPLDTKPSVVPAESASPP